MATTYKMFKVREYTNGGNGSKTYETIKTDEEMHKYLENMRNLYGYVPGLGGNKNYFIVAWYMNDSTGIIKFNENFERI